LARVYDDGDSFDRPEDQQWKWRIIPRPARPVRIPAMKLLAIDTSTEAGSIALLDGDRLLRRACPAGRSHSETLLPLIRDALLAADWRLPHLAGIAFAAGPGSFTGLRVACGVAQGLALASDLPVIAVGTLAAMALDSSGRQVIVALDARMGEVYHARFFEGQTQTEVAVDTPDAVPLPGSSGWLACGNGLRQYPRLRERLADCVEYWLPDLIPDAGAVARLGASGLARGEGIDAAAAAPFYVRNKVAQTVVERLANGGKA